MVCRLGLTGGGAGSFPVTGAITTRSFTQATQNLLLCILVLVDDKNIRAVQVRMVPGITRTGCLMMVMLFRKNLKSECSSTGI